MNKTICNVIAGVIVMSSSISFAQKSAFPSVPSELLFSSYVKKAHATKPTSLSSYVQLGLQQRGIESQSVGAGMRMHGDGTAASTQKPSAAFLAMTRTARAIGNTSYKAEVPKQSGILQLAEEIPLFVNPPHFPKEPEKR